MSDQPKRWQAHRLKIKRWKAELFAKQLGRCFYCHQPMAYTGQQDNPNLATLDHSLPRALGGKTIRENLVIACLSCNNAKADNPDYKP